jgi:hypothetical protein
VGLAYWIGVNRTMAPNLYAYCDGGYVPQVRRIQAAALRCPALAPPLPGGGRPLPGALHAPATLLAVPMASFCAAHVHEWTC